jgi:uncharacterized membrane protein
MTLWRKRALISALIWGAVATGFTASVLYGEGPNAYVEGSLQRNVGAGFLAAGIFGQLILSLFTRRKQRANRVTVDERDERISQRSSEVGFIAVAIGVFLAAIALHDFFRESGCVPVGWLWILAYSSWIVGYFAQAVSALILYAKMESAHGEG